MNSKGRLILKCALLPLVVCLMGCPGSTGGPKPTNAIKTSAVGGKVIVENMDPLMCGVNFYTESETDIEHPTSRGICDEYGKFTMNTMSTNDGVPPGKYKVLFTIPLFINEAGRPAHQDGFDGKYNDINNPQITVDIPPEGKNDLEFKVTALTKEERDAKIAELRSPDRKRKGGRARQEKAADQALQDAKANQEAEAAVKANEEAAAAKEAAGEAAPPQQ